MDADGLENMSESLWVLSGEGTKSCLSVCLFVCSNASFGSELALSLLLLFTFGEPCASEE